MTESYDVWIFHKRKTIEVTDFSGVPVELTSYVSEEAQQAAQERGIPTIGEIGFDKDCYLGPFDDFDKASDAAQAKARELGYDVDHILMDDDLYDDEEEYEPEYDFESYEDDDWDEDFNYEDGGPVETFPMDDGEDDE